MYTEEQIEEALYNAKCGGVPIELYTTKEEIKTLCDALFFPRGRISRAVAFLKTEQKPRFSEL